MDSRVGTLATMSVYVIMPTILSLFMTGSFLTLFLAMSLAVSSMLAVSFVVSTGLVMICLAVRVSGARHGSTSLLRMSRSVMIPTGLSPCTIIMEPMSNLFMVATTSFMLVSGRTTFTSFDMTSLTRTMPAILFFLQAVCNNLELSPLFVVVFLASISIVAGLCLIGFQVLSFKMHIRLCGFCSVLRKVDRVAYGFLW